MVTVNVHILILSYRHPEVSITALEMYKVVVHYDSGVIKPGTLYKVEAGPDPIEIEPKFSYNMILH